MWSNIMDKIGTEKRTRLKVELLTKKIDFLSSLIIQTKKSRLSKMYGSKDMKDILRVLENKRGELIGEKQDIKEPFRMRP